ncbi:MAG: hypothetical protein PHR35_02945 [Kiritimatiellae bacterium]|nr:hypothetical protein [Kiritimatiellia bacterium]
MKVRSKLSLATAAVLLTFLAVLYMGGRWIVLTTLRQVERNLLQTVPGIRQAVQQEISQIAAAAATLAAQPETRRLLAPETTAIQATGSTTGLLTRLDMHLHAVADSGGRLVTAHARLPQAPGVIVVPDPAIAEHLRQGGAPAGRRHQRRGDDFGCADAGRRPHADRGRGHQTGRCGGDQRYAGRGHPDSGAGVGGFAGA